MYQGGISYMWYSVSDTAEDGGYLGGDTLISDGVRQRMRGLLDEIRQGGYAERWIEENRSGRATFNARRNAEREHRIEEVGKGLRAMMPFLDAKSVPK